MKYAIVCVADQTIAYLSMDLEDWTTKHPEAILLSTRAEAEQVLSRHGYEGDWIEEVANEAEFRTREDTW